MSDEANNPESLADNTEAGLDQLIEQTRQKICHVLSIYPAVSATMIQTGIGTSTSPKLWRPILGRLVAEGAVSEVQINSTTPHDRHQVYTVYHLAAFDYQAYRNTQNPPSPTPAPEPQAKAA